MNDENVRHDPADASRIKTSAPPIPDPVTDPLGAYLHAEFERIFAREFPNRKPAQFI